MRERSKAPVMPATTQLLLSDTEVAAILGLGVSTVWKKKREIPTTASQPHCRSPKVQNAGDGPTSQSVSKACCPTTNRHKEAPATSARVCAFMVCHLNREKQYSPQASNTSRMSHKPARGRRRTSSFRCDDRGSSRAGKPSAHSRRRPSPRF